jgi:rRNA maturation RNase YbeY
MPPINQQKVTEWVRQVAATYRRHVGDINFIFVDDEEILRVNREFIGHDYYTDHIGFDYSQGTTISGDIYIGVDTVRTNSEKIGCDYMDELHRVIIHGVLHLCGIDDKGPGERAIMEAEEDKALELWKNLI